MCVSVYICVFVSPAGLSLSLSFVFVSLCVSLYLPFSVCVCMCVFKVCLFICLNYCLGAKKHVRTLKLATTHIKINELMVYALHSLKESQPIRYF